MSGSRKITPGVVSVSYFVLSYFVVKYGNFHLSLLERKIRMIQILCLNGACCLAHMVMSSDAIIYTYRHNSHTQNTRMTSQPASGCGEPPFSSPEQMTSR
jgi:hypothetical protein